MLIISKFVRSIAARTKCAHGQHVVRGPHA